jgi:hypothetical protein
MKPGGFNATAFNVYSPTSVVPPSPSSTSRPAAAVAIPRVVEIIPPPAAAAAAAAVRSIPVTLQPVEVSARGSEDSSSIGSVMEGAGTRVGSVVVSVGGWRVVVVAVSVARASPPAAAAAVRRTAVGVVSGGLALRVGALPAFPPLVPAAAAAAGGTRAAAAATAHALIIPTNAAAVTVPYAVTVTSAAGRAAVV